MLRISVQTDDNRSFFMEWIQNFSGILYNGLLYFTNWPLAVVLLLGGIYFSWRTKFVQIQLKETLRVT